MAASYHAQEEDTYGTGSSRQKPCRTCTDFKSWASMTKASIDKNSNHKKKETAPPPLLVDSSSNTCPVDKDQLGRNSWTFLHTIAAYYPDTPSTTERQTMTQFLSTFSQVYPCNICAEDMQKDLKTNPPDVTSQSTFSLWMCQMHNRVNTKLGKPVFDCSKVNERWRDGPADGSCD